MTEAGLDHAMKAQILACDIPRVFFRSGIGIGNPQMRRLGQQEDNRNGNKWQKWKHVNEHS